ncbi:MAG: prolipoprotein diacylglyceryl transferase family protein [Rhodothermales bacterium]
MYPRLSDIFRDLFGFSLPFPIYSFGAMVALGVLTAMWLTQRELDRMYAEGRLSSIRIQDDKSGKRGRPVTREASPSALIGTVTVLAVVLGIAGSKLFHILENLDTFYADPLGMIFSTGGLTFYGGLIVAGAGIAWYVRKKGLSPRAFADAFAPGLMIGYGIGRIGCHLAGDGDWGIAADMSLKPEWLPTWMWAETYPNNILGADLAAPGVYPTSIYEFLFAALLFGVLWVFRKHPYRGGWLFSFYLLLAGIERMLIEQIRVNNEFDLLGMTVTQAELISFAIILVGVVGLALTSKRRTPDRSAEEAVASAA